MYLILYLRIFEVVNLNMYYVYILIYQIILRIIYNFLFYFQINCNQLTNKLINLL